MGTSWCSWSWVPQNAQSLHPQCFTHLPLRMHFGRFSHRQLPDRSRQHQHGPKSRAFCMGSLLCTSLPLPRKPSFLRMLFSNNTTKGRDRSGRLLQDA